MNHTVEETSDELIRKIFELNFFAAHALTREALPHIRKVKGNILFMSSVAGKNIDEIPTKQS
jgi:NAD(P)-dependent dehydrogenase (short-subunit alcohol dehydrogenase family)